MTRDQVYGRRAVRVSETGIVGIKIPAHIDRVFTGKSKRLSIVGIRTGRLAQRQVAQAAVDQPHAVARS